MEWRTASSSGDVDGLGGVLNEGLSSSFYTPPRAVPSGVIHENMGNPLEEGVGYLTITNKSASGQTPL
jgi:hypothetical protein